MNMYVNPQKENQNGLSQTNYVEILVENYNKDLADIERDISALNNLSSKSRHLMSVCGTQLSKTTEGMLKHLLRVDYWNQVYIRSNIAEFLDTDKKESWRETLLVNPENKTEHPEFTVQNVLSTLESWYLDRDTFFADRVDSIFRALSRSHVTNTPEGFSKKMIFSTGCENSYSTGMDVTSKSRERLHDLACCIAKILNLPNPHYLTNHSTNNLDLGVKHQFYSGFFEIQVFKNGSLHLWVHPSIALDLNLWLAKKYPMAIPTEFRTKTAKIKEFTYTNDFLTKEDVQYVELVRDNRVWFNGEKFSREVRERFAKYVGSTVEKVEEKPTERNRYSIYYTLCNRLVRNGYPNIKDHQYYPTPKEIVESIQGYLGDQAASDSIKVLEPSAGSGNLASVFNANIVDCVEVSPLFCEVLKTKGFIQITNLDFLKFNTNNKYDFIVMNPPYANKRLENHLAHALTMLGENGELLIVAPTGKEKAIREIALNKSVNIISSHENVFDDTAIHTSVYSIT